MSELSIPVTSETPRVAKARALLASVCDWGSSLPLPLRLAAAAALAELEARANLPHPPAQVARADPELTQEAAAEHLRDAGRLLAQEIPDADPLTAIDLAFAVREIEAAQDVERRPQ